MNIFIFNEDPILAANDHCIKHMIKMPLELTQMLSTNVNLAGIKTCYKPCHVNHPCTKWIRESRSNFEWAVKHANALFENFYLYQGKEHKSKNVFLSVKDLSYLFPNKNLTPFAQAMPDVYKNNNAVIAYRSYFKAEKSHLAVWKGKIPDWY